MTDLTNTELADRLRAALRDAPSWDSVPVSAALLAEAARRLRGIGDAVSVMRETGHWRSLDAGDVIIETSLTDKQLSDLAARQTAPDYSWQ